MNNKQNVFDGISPLQKRTKSQQPQLAGTQSSVFSSGSLQNHKSHQQFKIINDNVKTQLNHQFKTLSKQNSKSVPKLSLNNEKQYFSATKAPMNMNTPPLITHTSNFTPQNFEKLKKQQMDQLQSLYSTQNTNFGNSQRYGSPFGKITNSEFQNMHKRNNSENNSNNKQMRDTLGNIRKQLYIKAKHRTEEGQEEARIRKVMNKDKNFVGPYLPSEQYKIFNSQLLNNYESKENKHFYNSMTVLDMTQQTEIASTLRKTKYLHNIFNQKSTQNSFQSQMSNTTTAFSHKIQGSSKNMDNNVVFLTRESIQDPQQIKTQLSSKYQKILDDKKKEEQQEEIEAQKAIQEQLQAKNKNKRGYLKKSNANSPISKNIKQNNNSNDDDDEDEQKQAKMLAQIKTKNKKFLTFDEIIENQKLEAENTLNDSKYSSNSENHKMVRFNSTSKLRSSNNIFNETNNKSVYQQINELYNSQQKIKTQLFHNRNQFDLANQQIGNIQSNIFKKAINKMKNDQERVKKVEKLVVHQKQVLNIEKNKKSQQKFDPQLLQQLASKNPVVERQRAKLQESYPDLKEDKHIANNSILSFFSEFSNDAQWKPQGRIGATMTYHNKHLFLIGGRANELVEDIAMLQLPQYKQQQMKWIRVSAAQNADTQNSESVSNYLKDNKQVSFQSITRKLSIGMKQNTNQTEQLNQPNDPFTGRFNHSACLYNNYIIVFGGESSFDNRSRSRTCLSQTFFFDTLTLKWEYKLCKGDYIEGRRNHAAAIVGHHMFVLGGVNHLEKNIDQLIYLDLNENLWKIYGQTGEYKNIFQNKGGLSYHTACSVYEEPKHQKLHNTKVHKKSHYIKEQGLYFYGGRFGNGKVNGDLYVLKTDYFPIHWKKLETLGAKPRKRYGHMMNYMQKLNILIISGGKTEQRGDNIYLDDTFILNLYTLEWKQVLFINPLQSMDRALATCDSFGTQMFIFGGMRNEKYFGSTLNMLEFDQEKVEQLARKKQNQKDQELLQQEAPELTEEEIQKRKSEIISINEAKKETFMDKIYDKMSKVKSFQPIPSLIGQHFKHVGKNNKENQQNSQQYK